MKMICKRKLSLILSVNMFLVTVTPSVAQANMCCDFFSSVPLLRYFFKKKVQPSFSSKVASVAKSGAKFVNKNIAQGLFTTASLVAVAVIFWKFFLNKKVDNFVNDNIRRPIDNGQRKASNIANDITGAVVNLKQKVLGGVNEEQDTADFLHRMFNGNRDTEDLDENIEGLQDAVFDLVSAVPKRVRTKLEKRKDARKNRLREIYIDAGVASEGGPYFSDGQQANDQQAEAQGVVQLAFDEASDSLSTAVLGKVYLDNESLAKIAAGTMKFCRKIDEHCGLVRKVDQVRNMYSFTGRLIKRVANVIYRPVKFMVNVQAIKQCEGQLAREEVIRGDSENKGDFLIEEVDEEGEVIEEEEEGPSGQETPCDDILNGSMGGMMSMAEGAGDLIYNSVAGTASFIGRVAKGLKNRIPYLRKNESNVLIEEVDEDGEVIEEEEDDSSEEEIACITSLEDAGSIEGMASVARGTGRLIYDGVAGTASFIGNAAKGLKNRIPYLRENGGYVFIKEVDEEGEVIEEEEEGPSGQETPCDTLESIEPVRAVGRIYNAITGAGQSAVSFFGWVKDVLKRGLEKGKPAQQEHQFDVSYPDEVGNPCTKEEIKRKERKRRRRRCLID